ncbi:alpha/beta hydrolase [Allorhizocola rhizosphaerae]|uniref:alpha/beta hydrolase n=1 Tax=Allorhizocola rhizosphaerae TaxID=1872709 RepID=UPI000E3CC570|nr:alpha/beta hydrolase [Allorhizocola rhizosphaerae]
MRTRRERARAPQLYALSVAEARELDLASIRDAGGTPEPVHSVVDSALPGSGLPIRVYRPSERTDLPVLVYFFGGGWTLGTIDTSDAVCRRLSNLVGCAVVAVGYRLAPEHKFPTAVHDCFDAVLWAAAEFGTAIAVGGDSAGGNLAAAVTLLARDEGVPLAAQVLVYPNTDYGAETDFDDPFLFNKTSVAWYWSHYLAKPEDGFHELASPLRASSLAGLPPALVITAEFDPLRDQAELYAKRLSESGVDTTLSRYDGMIHGFFCMAGDLEAGAHAQEEAAAFLKARLNA